MTPVMTAQLDYLAPTLPPTQQMECEERPVQATQSEVKTQTVQPQTTSARPTTTDVKQPKKRGRHPLPPKPETARCGCPQSVGKTYKWMSYVYHVRSKHYGIVPEKASHYLNGTPKMALPPPTPPAITAATPQEALNVSSSQQQQNPADQH